MNASIHLFGECAVVICGELNKEKNKGRCRLTREMEYAKCIAVLGKILRMGIITEKEYTSTKKYLMNKYMISYIR